MRNLNLLLALALCCLPMRSPAASPAHAAADRRAVAAIFAQMLQCSERADIDGALRYYDHGPDFAAAFGDGTVHDYRSFEKASREYFATVRSQKFTTHRSTVQIVDAGAAIVTWQADIVTTMKSGEVSRMAPFATTFVFRKTGSVWKVLHSHESSLAPVAEKSGRLAPAAGGRNG